MLHKCVLRWNTSPNPGLTFFSLPSPKSKAVCFTVILLVLQNTFSTPCTTAHTPVVTWNDDISESQHSKVVCFKALLQQVLGKHHCRQRGREELVGVGWSPAYPDSPPPPLLYEMHTSVFLGDRGLMITGPTAISPSGTTAG